MTTEVEDALSRLGSNYYNSDVVSPANPGGLADDGHVENFPAAINDIALVAGYLAGASGQILSAAETAAIAIAAAEDARNSFNSAKAQADLAQGYAASINPAAINAAIALKLDATKEATLKAFAVAVAYAV